MRDQGGVRGDDDLGHGGGEEHGEGGGHDRDVEVIVRDAEYWSIQIQKSLIYTGAGRGQKVNKVGDWTGRYRNRSWSIFRTL